MKREPSERLQILNPADHFTLAMDEEIRREGMPGSLCGFALELNQTPDFNELKGRIDEFIECFPISQASLQQRGKRFYWCQRKEIPEIYFQHSRPDIEDEEAFHKNTVEKIINQLQPRESISPLEFHLISGESRHTFLMRWIHPFCDARGADLILKFICTGDRKKRELFDLPKTEPLVNVQLKKFSWWKKIGLFFKAKRHIEQIDELQSILPVRSNQNPERLNYSVQRLSEEQTARIAKESRRQAGLTGGSLYFIGCLMRALDKLNPDREGDAYCAPYAFNLRKQKALSPVVGNHVCALFAQASREIVNDREQLFKHLKQQNANVIRQQLDYAFLPLMWAGSWLSLEKYGKALRQSYNTSTERTSFWFSDIGQPDLSGHDFPGAQITGLFHLCQMTTPPALALLSCQYQGRLTLTYNYIEPLIDREWIDSLHERMISELLGES